MSRTWDVVVVGSANLDVVLRVPTLPRPGQTLLATGTERGCGGKGANSAVAAARAGARTAFVGALGADAAADVLRTGLRGAGVDLSAVRVARSGTGTAYVLVDGGGENCIVVDPGANADLVDLAAAELALLADARVLLLQLEIPLVTVLTAARHARAAGVLTVLNAAPAQQLPPELDAVVDVLVVNEQEAVAVAGAGTGRGWPDAVRALLLRVPEVVVTLGAEGAVVAQRDAPTRQVPAFVPTAVVDTTGAGDTFCGTLAAARAHGLDPVAAAELASAAASLSVERSGAVPSVPDLASTRQRLATGARA